jgi:hypothetical protein
LGERVPARLVDSTLAAPVRYPGYRTVISMGGNLTEIGGRTLVLINASSITPIARVFVSDSVARDGEDSRGRASANRTVAEHYRFPYKLRVFHSCVVYPDTVWEGPPSAIGEISSSKQKQHTLPEAAGLNHTSNENY